MLVPFQFGIEKGNKSMRWLSRPCEVGSGVGSPPLPIVSGYGRGEDKRKNGQDLLV